MSMSDMGELIKTIEAYPFESEGGILTKCPHWAQLKEQIAATKDGEKTSAPAPAAPDMPREPEVWRECPHCGAGDIKIFYGNDNAKSYCNDCRRNFERPTSTVSEEDYGDLRDYARAQRTRADANERHAARYRAALERIVAWKFPATGRYWDEPINTQPMSYSAAYGSNGERDYMRTVAADALFNRAMAGAKGTPK